MPFKDLAWLSKPGAGACRSWRSFLVAEGVVDDISHEGLRVLLREDGVTSQRLKTWKAFTDPDNPGQEGPG